MGDLAPFAVDLDQLDETVASMSTCGRRFDEVLAEVEARVQALHLTWFGVASTAHRAAQDEWRQGFAQMSAALAELREAAGTAHRNYSSAVEANVRMWRS